MLSDGMLVVHAGLVMDVGNGSAKVSSMLPRAQIPMLREVVLLIGDGKPIDEVGYGIFMLVNAMRIPPIASMFGVLSPSAVWVFGMETTPPIFFDRDGRHHVDPQLLSEIRAQSLETCSCGAHYEVGTSCYLCAHRQDWAEVELHYNK